MNRDQLISAITAKIPPHLLTSEVAERLEKMSEEKLRTDLSYFPSEETVIPAQYAGVVELENKIRAQAEEIERLKAEILNMGRGE